MDRDVELAIRLSTDVGDTARDFDRVGDAADRMGRDVVDASRDSERATRDLGESADNLDSTAGKATGAMGALSSGFDLVGAEKYSAALGGAAMATDFLSGVGQSLTLILESERIVKLKSAIASGIQTAATKAQTVAQRALNLVMRANPIGLLIAAGVALAAGFAVLYNKSETFRGAVHAVGRFGKAALDLVINAARDVGSWFGRLGDAAGAAKRLAEPAINAILTPVRALRDMISSVVDWIGNIDWPEPPQWMQDAANGIGGAIGAVFRATDPRVGFMTDPGARGPAAPTSVVNVTINGAVDPTGTAQQLRRIQTRYAVVTGNPT